MESKTLPQRATGVPAAEPRKNYWAVTKSYVEDLQLEMRRVTWPNWKQVRATTLVVIASVFLFAAYFFVVDRVVAQLINKLFAAFTH